MFPASLILEAYGNGLRDFGENYIQEFEAKRAELGSLDGARFHFVGHLQSNKSRRATELFQVIQTVDSVKLIRRLGESGTPLEIMLEVKLSEEGSKSGAAPEEIPALVEAARSFPSLRLAGLMTMPPWFENPELARPYFRRLHGLAMQHGLDGLSMGTSNDFEAAIEEGATLIRLGEAIFGPRR
jgi:pyridoxal phosphate enzyme (YggS family)